MGSDPDCEEKSSDVWPRPSASHQHLDQEISLENPPLILNRAVEESEAASDCPDFNASVFRLWWDLLLVNVGKWFVKCRIVLCTDGVRIVSVDYREHQVTSYALSANDRAPMNRRKKSRQTDSFGIDRKRASKLRQTDILCIDRKRSAIDRETDILIFLPFSWNFVLGWHDCQWIFVGLSFHLNFFSDINLLWGAAGRSSDDGWCITGAKVWQGNPLSSMLASSQDYPGQWYLRLKYAKTTSHNDFQLWWISDFLEQPPLHNDPAVN